MQALVLHQRSYRETSSLVDFFTYDCGIVRAVVRSAKNKNGSLVQSFCELDLEIRGRKELKSAFKIEQKQFFLLQGKALFCGLYLNELILRLLPTFEANQVIFTAYLQVLADLHAGKDLEPVLRNFEHLLLQELGYGFTFTRDLADNEIEASAYYGFNPYKGFSKVDDVVSNEHILGQHLLAMNAGSWHLPEVLPSAKNIMRRAIAVHLGDKPLLSRKLFARQLS